MNKGKKADRTEGEIIKTLPNLLFRVRLIDGRECWRICSAECGKII